MDNLQFCYWLHGYFEIGDVAPKTTPYLNKHQIDVVRDHIDLVNDENPFTCTFIQWLQGVIDATRVLTLKNVDYVNISRGIKLKLEEVFDKKTPARTPEVPAPPIFPPLFVNPTDPIINPNVTCSTVPDEIKIDKADPHLEDKLRNVLKQYPIGGGRRSPHVFCAKED